MDDKETAIAPFVDYEAKANSDGDAGVVEGYASVFGARDHGRDKVWPGAFTKTLQERGKQVIYLPSHDYKVHVKDIPAVPLDIKEDGKGLHTTTKFFLNTQAGRDSFAVIKAYQEAGRPLGLSYTFKPTEKVMTSQGRDLKQVDLYEYGHTALPMLDLARTTSAKSDSNSMIHSDEVDHAHNHGDMIHSHPHTHKTNGSSYYDSYTGHANHDHSADQMKSLVVDESPKYWEVEDDERYESKRIFTQDERDKLAKEGSAMSDGSYPITDEASLKDAIQSVGRAKNYSAAKRHIISRARSLGKTDLLPEDWNVTKAINVITYIDSKDTALFEDFETLLGRKLKDDSASKIRSALADLQGLLMQEEEVDNNQDIIKKNLAQQEKDEIEKALARMI